MEMTILGPLTPGGGVQGRICIHMTLRPKQATLILLSFHEYGNDHFGHPDPGGGVTMTSYYDIAWGHLLLPLFNK